MRFAEGQWKNVKQALGIVTVTNDTARSFWISALITGAEVIAMKKLDIVSQAISPLLGGNEYLTYAATFALLYTATNLLDNGIQGIVEARKYQQTYMLLDDAEVYRSCGQVFSPKHDTDTKRSIMLAIIATASEVVVTHASRPAAKYLHLFIANEYVRHMFSFTATYTGFNLADNVFRLCCKPRTLKTFEIPDTVLERTSELSKIIEYEP